LNSLKGVINTQGKVVIPFKYETVYCDLSEDGFIMGIYPSKEVLSLSEAKKDYYNSNFELIQHNFQYIQHAQGSKYIPFKQNNEWGYLNRKYKIVIPAQYKKVKSFTDGVAFVFRE
jgi:hypothetical protein